jgi:hypothetical protein
MPVTQLEALDARKSTAVAISSGCLMERGRGLALRIDRLPA